MLVCIIQPFAYSHYHGVYYNPKRWSMPILWHFVVNRKMGNGRIYWRCSKRSCPARLTTQGEELFQVTNGHNHVLDETDSRVEQIRSNLRKRAREEVVPIPSVYNDALIELSTQHDHPMVAPKLPSFTSLKSSLYQSQLLLSFM